MNLKVPLLVSVDNREVYELFLPGILEKSFKGVSLAELRDDAALHLMELIPKEPASRMSLYQFCPHIELRKVKITVELTTRFFPEWMYGDTNQHPNQRKKKETWTGRLSVVVTRWPKDGFYTAYVPQLGLESFAVAKTAYLEEGLIRFVKAWAKKNYATNLDPYICRSYEYLDILDVDTELPTILPSRPKKKKKKKKKNKDKSKGKKKDKSKKQKRRLIPPDTLRKVGVNLTHRAIDGRLTQAFGRDALVDHICKQLQREGAAILLVGPSGVGKSAIIHEVVRRFAGQQQSLKERSDFWEVNGNRLIAGMKFVGAWEQRVQMMVHELHTRQDVLYVDDLPSLVYTGRSSHSDTNVAEYIEPHISRGELRIIGECTPERLEATREESPSFFARFRVIQIPELDERQTLMVLVHAMRRMEDLEHLTIQPEALESVLSLTRRFLVHHCYPGKAINLLMQLLSDYRNIERDQFKRRLITREHLIEFFSRQSGLPSFILWEQQARPHKEIKSYFARRIIGQDDAVETVTDVVTILQQGLNNPERPLATLMFVGPTGVGKTETAKALAEYLFGSAERLIRFDMSEFMHPSAVTRLIGDRFQPEGDLTRQVQQQPFSVILLDEVEKAHPSIFDAFLQVLGEGRLTNAAGHTIDFCNTVVIMTSNLGVKEANRSLGFATQDESQAQLHYRKAAESFFRPEFFNRIDRIVAFSKLTRASISPLVKRLLQQLLNRRGLRHSHVLVQVDPELVELLIDQGFDPQYGARSMKRLLEQRLTVPLAQHLVSHSVHQTTVIQLFRKKDNIGMELWGLEEIILKPFEHLKKARRWNELKLRFEQLKYALQGMEKSAELKQIVQERSELLATFNADEDNTDPPERLLSLSELLGGQMQLRKFMEQFEEDYMVDYHFIETSDHWYSQSKLWGPQKNTAFSQEPIEIDRQRLFPEAQEKIFQARIDFASLLYRTKAIQEKNLHPAILRFLPASESQSTQRWSIHLAQQFANCWTDWATIKYFAKRQDEWEEIQSKEWSEWYEQLRMGEEEVLQFFPESRMLEVQGVAITLHGPGMRPLLEDELGFYQHNAQEGPDLICDLVRIEEVSDSLRLPLEQLHHLDEAFEAYRETRRKGLDAENPRPQLPLIRVFNDGICEDQETGELIDHWKLDKDLHKIAMLRIFARFLAHTEQTAQPIDDVHDEPTSDDTQEA